MRLPLAFAAFLLAHAAHAAEPIRIGEPNWFSGKVSAMVLKEIFSSRYGYDAEIIPGSNPEIYHGMTGTDGAAPVDIHADSWQPGHSGWTAEALKAGTMALSAEGYEGRIGLCAPQYTLDKLGVKTVDDLKKPEVRKALDRDGDGEIEVWVGGAGWQMTAAYEVKLRDYGLESAGYTALIEGEGDYQTKLYAGFARRRDMVFACYEPMSWFAMEHIGYVTEPAYDPAKHNLVLPGESDDWKTKSRVTVGEEVAQVRVAWSTDLRKRFPKAAVLLQRFGLTNDDMVEFMFMADIKGIALDEVVRDWVKANEGRIAAWERAGS